MIDTFRHCYPDEIKYSFWSYRGNSREKGNGWRLDYFLISANGLNRVLSSEIRDTVMGSDHCPIEITFSL
jgi:exodeoxyribonuclease-3